MANVYDERGARIARMVGEGRRMYVRGPACPECGNDVYVAGPVAGETAGSAGGGIEIVGPVHFIACPRRGGGASTTVERVPAEFCLLEPGLAPGEP